MRVNCIGISVLLASPGLLFADAILRGRVVDAETGQPIACTVTVRAADGKIVTGHPSFRGGFRAEGTFEKAVPAGKLRVTVSRGFDYGAAEESMEARDGEARTLDIRLQRRTPLRKLGWVTGDSHVHMIHGEQTVTIDFPFAALSARAEGLDYMALAQQWNVPRVTPEDLDSACRRLGTGDFTLTWNLEAPKNFWRGDVSHCAGHGWTVGMRGRTAGGGNAIEELLSMSAWDYESEKPPFPNFEIQALVHSLGGIVSYTHPHRWWSAKWGGKGIFPVEPDKFISNLAQELPFDTVAGPTYDMIDILMQTHEREVNRKGLALWFMLLNHGYRIAATGSSDATFDNPGGGIPGVIRVYTRVDGQPTLERIASAMKQGRNFVTSGPLARFQLGSHEVGDVVPLDGPKKLHGRMQAWASGKAGEHLSKVELIRNGEVVRQFDTEDPVFETSFDVEERETAWYLVRCYGSGDTQVAITNPIYFQSPSYRAPVAEAAQVAGVVTDAETGKPLDGIAEVLEFVGRTPVRHSEVAFRNGRLELQAPATARIRVRVDGYEPSLKSIFMDYQPLLSMMLDMRSEQLGEWSTFEKTRQLLRNVSLQFRMAKR